MKSDNSSYVALDGDDVNDDHQRKKSCLCAGIDCRMRNLDDNDTPFKNKVTGKYDRKLTDPCCLLILIGMIIIDIYIYEYALAQGADIQLLYKGHDYKGKVCSDWSAWYNTNQTFIDITRCTANCSDATIQSYTAQEFEDHWCVPDKVLYKQMYENKEFDFSRGSATYARTIADLITQWNQITWICLASVLVSLLYLLFIQFNQRLLAYVIMNLIFGLVAGIILIIHGKKDIEDPLTDNTAVVEVIEGIIIVIFAGMIAMWFMRDREALMTEIEMMAEAKEVSF